MLVAVELARRESRSSWREFLLQLRERGLSGVEFVVSDDHAGLRQAIVEVLPEAAWQRCGACPRAGLRPDPGVHFLRNALDYVPRKVPRGVRGPHGPAGDDCLREHALGKGGVEWPIRGGETVRKGRIGGATGTPVKPSTPRFQ